ncbi:Shedu immune nuclease family protein [uncultured Marivirga sp.]|uniref:Shedu immune nuclease family protein n=1 Tax=uncultured Marivirga sp. TaxID=1123707 RepID=UPI0030ED3E50|tara:strand:- start:1343 stop:2641 length:1299 start_codon:yes stop_codon:yes gene_type:complete
MATEEPIREEKELKKTATRIIYEFIDSEKEIKKISKEVYLNKDCEVHFPWGYDGKDKYANVKKFIYNGFEGKLPVGTIKAAAFGYGFNSKLKPIGDFIGELKIETIEIKKGGTPKIDITNNKIILNEHIMRRLYDVFTVKLDQQSQDRANLAQQQLKVVFPDDIEEVELKYVKNSIAEVVSTWGSSIKEFSDKDKSAIKEMFDKLSVTDDFLTSETLLDTKKKLDAKYIEDVIEEFKVLMDRTADSTATEKKWQEYLNKHSWIFSHIFSFPIILFQDEAYVGGKNLSNKNGKLNDFLVKNNLTENVAFIEIKTHKTELIKKGKPYRGTDVFGLSDDLSGGISQVLNQRDNFQKHFANIKMETEEPFETYNSKCVVLMGEIKGLTKKQLRSFELLRSNSKDVEILTFDELLARIESLQKLIQGKVKPKKKNKI